MGVTTNDGPNIAAGPLLYVPMQGIPEYNPVAGPAVTYQGDSIPDVRNQIQKDYLYPGIIRAHFDSTYLLITDAVPVAAGAAVIAAAANVTNGTAMTLTTTGQTGVAPGIPILDSTGTLRTVQAIEFGFGTANCTSGNAVVVISAAAQATNYIFPGQWLCLANVGNSGATTALIAQVLSISGTNVTLSAAPAATNSAAKIGSCNIPTLRDGNPTPIAAAPYLSGPTSVAAMLNPAESLSRVVSITGSTSATGGAFTVRGYDIYGYAMTETITHPGGTGVQYGIKAFKYIASVTPGFTDAHNYSVGIGDTFGIHARTDRWEYTNLFWAGGFLSASTGWTAASTTNPSTATTADVRGTLQLGTNGAGSGATNSPDGSRRLAIFVSIPLYQMLKTTNQDPTAMYGIAQFSG